MHYSAFKNVPIYFLDQSWSSIGSVLSLADAKL